MKKLNLESFGVQEMNTKEMAEVQGGFLGFLLGAAAVGIALWGIANFVKDVLINGERFDMTEW